MLIMTKFMLIMVLMMMMQHPAVLFGTVSCSFPHKVRRNVTLNSIPLGYKRNKTYIDMPHTAVDACY